MKKFMSLVGRAVGEDICLVGVDALEVSIEDTTLNSLVYK